MTYTMFSHCRRRVPLVWRRPIGASLGILLSGPSSDLAQDKCDSRDNPCCRYEAYKSSPEARIDGATQQQKGEDAGDAQKAIEPYVEASEAMLVDLLQQRRITNRS
jgi:hypothetical protein